MDLINLKTDWLSFWRLQIVGWLLYAVMIYITFLTVLPVEGGYLRLLHIKLFRSLVGFILSSILRFIYRSIAHKYSLRLVVLLALSCVSVFSIVWTTFDYLYKWLTLTTFQTDVAIATFPRTALDYAMTLTAWSALYFGIKYWQAWQVERERVLQAAAMAHQAHLEMLRYQLNPHFLFNALNSIRASIDEDSRRAKQMITGFSEFLRYSLLTNNVENVSLREELEAIRNYLAIEKIRFEDKLEVEFDVEPAAEDYLLPAFLIHPLIENAIKHGRMSNSTPLKIRVIAQVCGGSLRVQIANSGCLAKFLTPTLPNSNGTRTGLSNVRQRLAQLYPKRSQFTLEEDNGWVCAIIEINQT
ncbi:MAG: histidine kinase [Acidobacteriota bacterium]